MNNSELIKLIHKETQISATDIKDVLDALSKYVCVGLLKQEEVQITRLGKLKLRWVKPRVVHNFKTNKRYKSKPSMRVQYQPSKTVQYFVNKLNVGLRLKEPDEGS